MSVDGSGALKHVQVAYIHRAMSPEDSLKRQAHLGGGAGSIRL